MRNLFSYEKSYSSTRDLPFGAFKNESSAGAKDGTDIVAEHMQDIYYCLYQVLQLAGVNPNGELEDGNTSKQFISALTKVTACIYSAAIKYAKNAIVLNIVSDTISVYKSLIDENTNVLTNSDAWLLLAKISPEGVFGNMTINSPTLTGIPTAPTATSNTSNKQIATTEFVKNYLSDNVILPIKTWHSGSNWYRLYSDNWLEQGGYSNPTGYKSYLQTINLHLPYNNTDYSLIVTAESAFRNGQGNCGYDYVQKGSKTVKSFNLISCTPSHYYRQCWVAKGYVTN